MLTNPSTLGLFETQIQEIAADRSRGRRDALLRRRQPQRDHGHLSARRHGLRHRALQPAQVLHPAPRRRRPRRGADRGLGADRAVSAAAPGRPGSATHNGSDRPTDIDLDYDRPKSIGRLRGFQGNYGVFVRSYAYIRSLGAAGLKDVSETAVLNANYLLARLRTLGVLEQCCRRLRPAVHARVRALRRADEARAGASSTLDLAKRLLDHGVHPPTVYFPLLVDGGAAGRADRGPRPRRRSTTSPSSSPTVLRRGRAGIRRSPAARRTRPRCGRLDEAAAARRPVIRQAAVTPTLRRLRRRRGRRGRRRAADAQAGHDVALIARGAHLAAIRNDGPDG